MKKGILFFIFLYSFVIQEKIPVYLYSRGQRYPSYSLLLIEREGQWELRLLKASL